MMEDDDPHDHAHRGDSDATGELQRVPPARMFHAGRVPLEHGGWLDDARLSYQVWGTPAAAADNVVLMPTYYTGRHGDNARLVGAGRALDPARWCIVIPDMLGNGLSSSPSNTGGAQHGAGFPHVSLRDNVYLQRRLLVEVLGVERVRLVLGWSMGGMQAYQWASSYPDAVRAVLCICGAARVSPHNQVFLAGLKAALEADSTFAGGRYIVPPARGLRAFARVYAGWAYSQAFFRRGAWRELGHASCAALLADWEREHLAWDANDLLAMLWSWQHADIARAGGFATLAAALAAIPARVIAMPCATDLYFPPADNALEVAALPAGELRVIDSDWGHVAGGPDREPRATARIEQAIRDLLD